MNGYRRRVLRGLLGGGAVTVGLPLLNCFLNGNGSAMADGRPLPLRFGTWLWALGVTPSIFVPKTTGANYELLEELAALKPVKQHMNMLTNFEAFRDGYENFCHLTGWVVTRMGFAPKNRDERNQSFDVKIANTVGRTTRYKLLTASSSGGGSFSYDDGASPNTAESSPVAFYQRLFGPDFQDPNAPTFTPNPHVMLRKSVLSAVMDDVKDLEKTVGAEDRARLDQYFTGLRTLERQFDKRLEKPEPLAACKPTGAVKQDPPQGADVTDIIVRHKVMSELLAMAVACDQTRVFNMSYGSGGGTVRKGYEKTHHTTTHEERIDEKLGYQVNCSWFVRRQLEAWTDMIQAFASIKEGDGTLLDNCFITADSDHSVARLHGLSNMVMFTAGRLGGKVKTGLHIDGGGTTTVRLPYTAMKLMGVNVDSFGVGGNKTSQEVGEILV